MGVSVYFSVNKMIPKIYGRINERNRSSKSYEFINPYGEVVIINNLFKFCETNNFRNNRFWELILGKKKSYKGWKFLSKI